MTATAAPPTASGARRARLRAAVVGWAFLAPLLVLNLLVVLGPSLATVYYSFTDWSGLGPATFIGLDNYVKAFGDAKVHQALLHNLVWFVLFLTVPMAMGLLGAYLLSQVRRFQMLFRALYFIPYVVASVVNAAVWKMLLSPTSGIAHQFGVDQAWLGDTSTSLLSVNFVVDWHWWGFLAVIFLSAMQGVDPALYDAAKVDGASRWQQYRNVTLPGIRPTMVFIVLMTVIWSLKAFDYIFIMTQGGPAGSSEVVSTLMYKQAFNEYSAGYAAALGLSMTLVTAVILAVYQWMRKKGWEDE
ncbi:carbohydrate ABC transporter membrane protein 1, CUT1 family [Micromonospora coriariae]|uniref:Carbohydrate ABC transporter membrane protein 1, CUT1 family n=1 Tax=Micromonospora coriariae TaxID=285665 RepID=A0A1C4U2B6_9ACTN|nr:sugar ABC transporter permease [Micromonospora coriariae]SCE65784.1 carbohydrate ABC transporter membrane protein 1, CUT1 family [Micromonospora coriariae]